MATRFGVQFDGGKTRCFLCNHNEFYLLQGRYFCQLCDGQTIGGEVEFVEEDDFSGATRNLQILRQGLPTVTETKVNNITIDGAEADVEKETSQPKHKRKNILSTWELHNYVLRVYVDRLMEIGFPATVKNKVFQLWLAYLIKRKAVFVCPTESTSTYPVSLMERKRNLEAFYCFKKPRIPVKRKSTKECPEPEIDNFVSVSQEKKRRTMAQRKAIEKDYIDSQKSQEENETGIHDYGSIKGLLNPPKTAFKPKFELTQASKSLRKAMHEEDLQRTSTMTQKTLFPEKFNFRIMLALIFIALRQVGFPVVFTDLQRLVQDGTLFLTSSQLLFEEELLTDLNVPFDLMLDNMFGQLQNVNDAAHSINGIVEYLGMQQFRYPTLKEVLPKFVDEFALPREMECLLHQIVKLLPLEKMIHCMKNKPTNIKLKPLVEVFMVCFITVVLKLLFGLDDVTEKYQSKFAKALDTVLMERDLRRKRFRKHLCPNRNWERPFVIEDWFRYLKHRGELIDLELFSPLRKTPLKVPNLNRLNSLIERYGSHYENSNTTFQKTRDMFRNFSAQILDEDSEEIRDIPPYVTIKLPNESIVDNFLQNQPRVSYPDLAHDFTHPSFQERRIDFIFDPDKYIPLLEKAGYTVKVVKGDARSYKPSKRESEQKLVLFQPYKDFDDYVGPSEQTSASLNYILSLCTQILVGRKSDTRTRVVLERLMGDLATGISRLCLSAMVPIYPYSDESEQDSNSDTPNCENTSDEDDIY